MDKKAVLQYQELSSNSWPARTCIFLNGWVVRVSEGVTKRANSVLPIRYTGDIREDITAVEAIYKQRDLPVIFQLPDYVEPHNLKEILSSLNYTSTDETLVMTAKIEDSSLNMNDEYSYSFAHAEDWLQALTDISPQYHESLDGMKQVIGRIPFPKVFCCAHHKAIVGVGLGVVERTFLGMYSLNVNPEYRLKGIGHSIVTKIIQWGKSHGATHMYLQVHSRNGEAISFYRKIGFQERYRYRYFVSPG
jgi:ribosomal protein S18 acetylase RimI-like enzyme